MTPSISSDAAFTAEDYLVYLRCPRSAHLRLSGRAAGADPVTCGDVVLPEVSDRDEVRDAALSGLSFPSDRKTGVGLKTGPLAATVDVWHSQRPSGHAAVLIREASSLKQAYLIESAFVRYCAERSGEVPSRQFVCFLNKGYVYSGELAPEELFVLADVTRRVGLIYEEHVQLLDSLVEELRADATLERYARTLCARPYSCPVCSNDLPHVDDDHITNLYRGGELSAVLGQEGYRSITDVPEKRLPHPRQRIQRAALVSGEPHVNHDELRRFLDTLRYPVHYLDFEAVNSALPRYDGTRPWEHVPYLFSLHTESEPGAEPTHTGFLMTPPRDERRQLLEALLKATAGEGSVVVYGAAFETSVLGRLAEVFQDLSLAIGDVISRVADLLQPFNEFSYYHHSQRGKVSLKTILPILSSDIYEGLAVKDGLTANMGYRYLETVALGNGDKKAAGPDPRTLAAELERYCSMDTMAMVQIMRKLRLLLEESGNL